MPRPKEAILSRDLIRDQALAIIDESGLESLTMRRLATRLGVQAASLYTHFPNKEAVLEAIAGRLTKHIDPSGFDESWQAGLRTWAQSYYAAIHWHPRAAPVVAAAHENAEQRAMLDAVHAGLVEHGWPDEQATMVSAAATYLVLGAATTATGDGSTARNSGRAGFTLALDSLIRGLEPLHDDAR